MKKKRIYISGKITGLELSEANKNFDLVQSSFSRLNTYKVVNPMREVPYVEGKVYNEYLVDCIKHLIECDTIFMLKNWGQSKGARVERAIALELGMEIIYQE